MAEIDVVGADTGTYRVTVTEGPSCSTHSVTVGPEASALLEEGETESELVVASFRFLLDREPKESIMSRFDLDVIGRYFPDYRTKVREYL